MKRFFRKGFATTMLLAGLLAAGVAFAAWTATGSGSGYAKAVSAQDLTTVDVSASTVADLYPGKDDGDVLLRVSNPNPYPVRITGVSGDGTITSDQGAACNASTGVTFDNQSGLALDVAASSAATFTLDGAAAMSNASDNTCQGALFTIPVSLSGQSNA
jgi:hypothetical protein